MDVGRVHNGIGRVYEMYARHERSSRSGSVRMLARIRMGSSSGFCSCASCASDAWDATYVSR